jgi:hypothetical protein
MAADYADKRRWILHLAAHSAVINARALGLESCVRRHPKRHLRHLRLSAA